MTTGALQGLLYCGNILIPSLFPFMVLSSFIVKSGIADLIGRFLTPITKKLFHTNGTVGTIILLGLTGGFPVGAKGMAELYEKGKVDLETAKAVTMFLVGGGPGFVVMVVGKSLYGSTTTGLLLWLCQISAQIITGVFACRKIKFSNTNKSYIKKIPFSTAIVSSTQSGIDSIISLCGLVIIFSCIFGIFTDLHIIDFICNALTKIKIPKPISECLLNIIWEVTNGCNTCCDNTAPIWLTSFALGWGGICVHFQIYSLTSNLKISKLKFTAYRFFQGIITSILSSIIFYFYTPSKDVYKSIFQSNIVNSNNYIGSIALIGMCIVFIMCIDNKHKKT